MPAARILAAVVLAWVVVACGIGASDSPCLGEVSDPADPPSHHDPELEARIPDTVAGEPLEVQSLCANVSEIGGITMTPEFLDRLGVDVADVTFATSNPSIGDRVAVSISAFRYRNASEDAIRSAFSDAVGDAGGALHEETRAGKDVVIGTGVAAGVVAYFAEDTLFMVSGDEEQLAELLAGLP